MMAHLVPHAEPRTAEEVMALARAVRRRIDAGAMRPVAAALHALQPPVREPAAPVRVAAPMPARAAPPPPVRLLGAFNRPMRPITGWRGEIFGPDLLHLTARETGLPPEVVMAGTTPAAIAGFRLCAWLMHEATHLLPVDIAHVLWRGQGRDMVRAVASVEARRITEPDFRAWTDGLRAAAVAVTGMDRTVPLPDGAARAVAVTEMLGERTGRMRALVAMVFDICEADITGGARHGPFVAARQAYVWLLRRATHLSLKQIAWLARRDHTTVLHGVNRVDARRARDAAYRDMTDRLMALACDVTGAGRVAP